MRLELEERERIARENMQRRLLQKQEEVKRKKDDVLRRDAERKEVLNKALLGAIKALLRRGAQGGP